MLLLPFSVLAQNTLKGKVVDQSNSQPLAGVSIAISGTKTATLTDSNGSFTLNNVKSGDTVTFTFLGYTSQSIKYTGQPTIEVSLTAGDKAIEEVVVVGYGKVKKKDATGSVTTVTEKDFVKGPVVAVDQMIQGKVAGLSITSGGGSPGEGASIRIRGGASLNAYNDPLFVIDGVPVDGGVTGGRNPLATINQNDIESVTVLKDASATAIYGFRASNGVIIITTKKGKAGALKVNYNGNVSVSQVGRSADVMDGNQFRSYVNANGSANQIALMGAANTDWQKEIYRTALGTDHNIAFSGGEKWLTYRASVGLTDMNGILKRDNMNRATTGVALVANFFDNHLKFEFNNKTSVLKNNYSNRGAVSSALAMDPTQSVYNTDGTYFQWIDINSSNNLAVRNPLSLIEQQNNFGTSFRSLGNLQTEYKFHFLPELKAVANFGYDYQSGRSYGNVSTNFAYTDAQGDAYENNNLRKNRLMDLYLNYKKDINAIKGNIEFTAGYSYQNFNDISNGFTLQGNSTQPPVYNSPFDDVTNFQSFFGRGIFNFFNKYIVTATIRRDGTSRFTEENRWGNFPSVALAWKLNEENFLKNVTTITDLKLRLGWGVTGQQNIGRKYPSLPLFFSSDTQAQYQLGNQFYNTVRPEMSNPNLKWEETTTKNIGLDFGLFNNRLTGSVDVYEKDTKDLLAFIPVPAFAGLTNFFDYNIGNLNNKGIEVMSNLELVKKDDFYISVGGNITVQKTKITSLIEEASDARIETGDNVSVGNQVQVQQVGYAPGSFWVYEQAYDANGKPINGVYIDRNGDGIVNEKDKYIYKKPAADVYYGLNTQIRYKNWDFAMSWRGSWGNYLYNRVDSNLGWKDAVLLNNNFLGNGTVDLLENNFTDQSTQRYQSDYYIQKASFIRMDNVTIGYNFNNFLGTKTNAKLSLAGQNLLLFTPYKGIDPELTSGVDYTIYPRPRMYTLGLNINF